MSLCSLATSNIAVMPLSHKSRSSLIIIQYLVRIQISVIRKISPHGWFESGTTTWLLRFMVYLLAIAVPSLFVGWGDWLCVAKDVTHSGPAEWFS